MKVSAVMTKGVRTVKPEDTARKAAMVMNKHGIGSVVVASGRKAVGIITERDLLKRVVAKNKKADAKRAEPPVGLPIGSDDVDVYAMPTRMPVSTHAPVLSAHQGGSAASHGESSHAEPSHDEAHGELHEPEIRLPGMEAEPELESLPSAHQFTPDEEGEDGLDAVDMGPPADVELPGPPPGWVDDGIPPNLPV